MCLYIIIYIYYYIILYIIIYLYLYIIIFIYIIIIYIVMCPKNGTIFMLRVPEMGLFIFWIWFLYLVYVYMGNVESTPGVVFLFVWWVFYSELFLYFEKHGFYMGTGVVFWCMGLWCDEECKWIVCGFWFWL